MSFRCSYADLDQRQHQRAFDFRFPPMAKATPLVGRHRTEDFRKHESFANQTKRAVRVG